MKKTMIWILVCWCTLQVSAQQLRYGTVSVQNSNENRGDVIELTRPKFKDDVSFMQVLKSRETIRSFSTEELPIEELSNLLWAANGVNRPETGKRTAPSARNSQEIDIYVLMKEGVYLYEPVKNILVKVSGEDIRDKVSEQKFFKQAPVVLLFVADYGKMEGFSDEAKEFYSATDVGYVSQNVYLYCSGANLATVVCGAIDRDFAKGMLKIKDGKVLLAQPVGYKSIRR